MARLCHFLPNSDVINTPFGRSHEYSIGSPEAVLNFLKSAKAEQEDDDSTHDPVKFAEAE